MKTDKIHTTTRREFVGRITAVAVCGAFARIETVAAKAPENKELLVAPCGLYCGACPMYLATQENDDTRIKAMLEQFGAKNVKITAADMACDGCIGGGRIAAFCRKCAMRECTEAKPDVMRCADCTDFPCSKITNFNNDGMLHHAEVLDNCRSLREVGIREWAKREEEKWSCPQCNANIAWYDGACSRCGAKRSNRLFPLKQA